MLKLFAKNLKKDTFNFYDFDIEHAIKVLRIKINDEIQVTFESKKYITKVISLEPLLTKIINEIKINKKLFQLDLYQSLIKPKSFEKVLSESIQLDVDNFYPVLFNRTQNQYNNLIRLDKISITNSKQSNRINHINIHNSIKFENLLDSLKINKYDLIIIPYENSEPQYLSGNDFSSSISKVAIIIGPEGGFEEFEIKKLSNISNVKIIKLTNTILRSETAAIYAISIVSNFIFIARSQ